MQTKHSIFRLFLSAAALSILIFTGGACSSKTGDSTKVEAAENLPTDAADADVNSALKVIEKTPASPDGYIQLSTVYIKKARATGDFSLNSKAETAVNRALEIEPQNLLARKLQASLNLTFHRFQNALELGLSLQKEIPNDAFVYGVLTDANVELGNYKEAVEAAQKMVDLKPNSSAYARVSHIRSLRGDTKGAIEMMKTAARTADPQDKEAQSWCLVQLGKEYFKTGDFASAEKIYDEALQNFPGYYLALAEKGIARAAQNDIDAAIEFLTKAQNRVPQTETIIVAGDLYASRGDAERAKQQYDLAEIIEQKFGNTDLRRLALLWADKDIKLDEALTIAEREHAARKDVYTADIYAWCLYKNGKFEQAKIAVKEAMRLETKDARIFYHAGMTEKSLGNKTEAAKFLQLALQTNPAFDFGQAEKARATLRELK
ncbi:MAG TPA: tetratricopeptide repeat protein [Pyrinomonadaceae bacterium]|jgi:tetratricopeptide (TPR) repeat protein